MHKKSRTSLFLMELIISILLFAVASAVCIQLFVHTHLTGLHTKALQFATLETQNIAEQIRGGVMTAAPTIYYYDGTFEKCSAKDTASYSIEIKADESGNLVSVTIQVTDLEKNEVLHEVSFQKFQPLANGKEVS